MNEKSINKVRSTHFIRVTKILKYVVLANPFTGTQLWGSGWEDLSCPSLKTGIKCSEFGKYTLTVCNHFLNILLKMDF